MSTQMIIPMDPELKEKFRRLARREGKTTSQLVRELIEEYVRKNDKGSYIDELWERIGKEIRARGATPATVGRTIKEIRKEKRLRVQGNNP